MLFRFKRFLHIGIEVFDLVIVAWSVLLASARHPVLRWGDLGILFSRPDLGDLLAFAGLSCGLWWLVAIRSHLYRSRRMDSFPSEFWVIAQGWLVVVSVAAFAAGAFWERGVPVDTVRLFVNGLLLFAAQRFVVRAGLVVLRRHGRNTRSILFVGWGRSARSLQLSFAANPHFGIVPVGIVTFTDEELDEGLPCPVAGSIHDLRRVLVQSRPQIVLIAPPPTASTLEIAEAFEVCDQAGLPCAWTPPAFGNNLRPQVEDFGGAPVVSFVPAQFGEAAALTKRVFDFVAASIAILLLSPVYLTIAVAIKLDDRGPVLFRQRRVGRFGREFTCFKFRTMVVGADKLKATLAELNEEDGPAFKMRNDPRVTRVGRLLRKYSLDELPQLLNVARGDMSLVGPRPPTPDEVDHYEWAWRRRLSVRPGLTCIWQIWGRNKVPFRRWMEMDLWYIDSWSLWKDVKLILRTLLVVLRGTGS